MTNNAIRVENLSKQYRIGLREHYKTLRDSLGDAFYAPFRGLKKLSRRAFQRSQSLQADVGFGDSNSEFIWALRDVSFDVKRGEVVGIIGRNGAGKSTLLKILSRITEPTQGCVEIHGRVGSLLEVGTGFHPELTGRENMYLNGAIIGMRKAEVERRFDEMVAFAEVDKFLDTPVKHYSSGMYVRLAFAVAAHLETEILLVDEILAVGDVAFQKKCLAKMGDVAKAGRTVVFVSHNMAAIQHLSLKCILLEAGRLLTGGETNKVVATYLTFTQQGVGDELESRRDRKGNGTLRFVKMSFHHGDGRPTPMLATGAECEVRLEYYMRDQVPRSARILIGISVNDMYGDGLFLCSNELTGEIGAAWPPSGQVICRIHQLPLLAGLYRINAYAAINGEVADWVENAATLYVEYLDFFGTGRCPPSGHSRFLVPHSWSIAEQVERTVS